MKQLLTIRNTACSRTFLTPRTMAQVFNSSFCGWCFFCLTIKSDSGQTCSELANYFPDVDVSSGEGDLASSFSLDAEARAKTQVTLHEAITPSSSLRRFSFLTATTLAGLPVRPKELSYGPRANSFGNKAELSSELHEPARSLSVCAMPNP